MKTWNKAVIIAASIAILGIAFAADDDSRMSSYMRHLLQLRSPAAVRGDLEIKAHAIQAPAVAKVTLGIQAGTNIISADSTVTNTFATAFATAPFVTMSRFTAGGVTNPVIVSVSTTRFIAWGETNSPFHWQAIGAP